MTILTLMHRIAADVGLTQKASPTSTPHVIDCHGLTLENLSPNRFEEELRDRQGWIEDQCQRGRQIGPLRDAKKKIVGRQFRFESKTEATAFKMVFPTQL